MRWLAGLLLLAQAVLGQGGAGGPVASPSGEYLGERALFRCLEVLKGLEVQAFYREGPDLLVLLGRESDEVGRDHVVAPLPADVKKNVVWRDTYWMPDEAASIYARALAVVSIECHSPLIALHVGTPTFYIRQPTDTCKGQMYRDIGADDWFFEIDETSGAQLWSRLEAIHKDPAAARAKVKSIMATVEARQKRMVDAVVARGYGGLLMYDPMNIRYATDTTNMQLWNTHNPFRAVLVCADGYMVIWDYKNSPFLSTFNPLVREQRSGADLFYFDQID